MSHHENITRIKAVYNALGPLKVEKRALVSLIRLPGHNQTF